MSRCITPHPDCPECKGTGKCQACDGEGVVDVELYAPPWALERRYDHGECDECWNGSGECRRCEETALEIEKYGPHE